MAVSRRRLVRRNDLAELSRLSGWLETAARELHLPRDTAFAAELCLAEAVTNVISYGYPDGGTHEVVLSLTREPDRLVLAVEDDGIAFNPLGVAAPVPVSRIEEVAIGGLGIHLIRRFMDDVRYEREDNRNRLAMAVWLPATEPAP